MKENIILNRFPKQMGVYWIISSKEIIYVGSSKNIYNRMVVHKTAIKKGSDHGYKQDFYQFLQSNEFTVEFQLTDDYRQLEQELIEQHHPKYNANRAYTGVAWNGNRAEYDKERYQKYKEEFLGNYKQYYETHKEEIKQHSKEYMNKYNNQQCLYEGETLTLSALRERFMRQGIDHPTAEAKKYIKKETKTPIEFYDVYP